MNTSRVSAHVYVYTLFIIMIRTGINYDGKDGGRHDDTVSATPPQLPSTNIQPKAHQPLVSYPDLVKQYKQTLVPFNEDKLQGSLSFTSLTSAQRKALYEVCILIMHVHYMIEMSQIN